MQKKILILGAALALATVAVHAAPPPPQKKEPAPKPYPLKTCVVTGMKLGSMGDAYVHRHRGKEVRFCCAGCLPAFKKDPPKYLAKIKAAETKEKAAAARQPAGGRNSGEVPKPLGR